MRRLTGVGMFQLQSWTAVVTAPLLLLASFAFETGQFDAIANAERHRLGRTPLHRLRRQPHRPQRLLLSAPALRGLADRPALAALADPRRRLRRLGSRRTADARLLLGATIAFIGVGVLAIRGKVPVESEI